MSALLPMMIRTGLGRLLVLTPDARGATLRAFIEETNYIDPALVGDIADALPADSRPLFLALVDSLTSAHVHT